ncbi:hypothetical protein [Sandaracinus amylolyticus]|uniref:hypothetical protein n=1 Tax=Sandaracinus amylolyticus TaxID=927083 RepID=UPI0012EDF1DE|nr:hypothetical protein [Sandaracinus amylolyticus]
MRFSIFTVLVLSLATACSNPVDEIDEGVDCANICDRYRDCYDEDYDTGACRDRCDDLVDGENGDSNAADACDGCLDDRSCIDATFSCASECAGILP